MPNSTIPIYGPILASISVASAHDAERVMFTSGSGVIFSSSRMQACGVPAEIITSDRVPNSCICSWAYSREKLTLKHYNAACPVHLEILAG